DSNEVTIVPPTPVDPNIVKDVEGLDHIVVEEGDNYNYNVKSVIPQDVKGYKTLTITDTLDSRLEVVGTKVLVDGKVTKFTADIKGNNVKLELTRDQLEGLQGKEVDLQITAKIKEGTGIVTVPNKAEIQLNNKPAIDSNVVTVIPPTPDEPNIVKDVNGEKHAIVEHETNFDYNVKSVIPKDTKGYKSLTLKDTLDSRLDIVSTKVLVDGKPSIFKAIVEGQEVKLTIDRSQLKSIEGKTVNLVITTKIKEGTPIETIDNKATIQLNDKPEVDSNVVTVVPPTPI
ncbi:isopeptide-forming domain-containing fimbrial protein, partial [Bacillus cereus]|uniref:isopeptide-forming domain-containing fimbrial protein n=1 Tax=Bacillus cereus TaxID=1396 RepID=UPI003D1701BA